MPRFASLSGLDRSSLLKRLEKPDSNKRSYGTEFRSDKARDCAHNLKPQQKFNPYEPTRRVLP